MNFNFDNLLILRIETVITPMIQTEISIIKIEKSTESEILGILNVLL